MQWCIQIDYSMKSKPFDTLNHISIFQTLFYLVCENLVQPCPHSVCKLHLELSSLSCITI